MSANAVAIIPARGGSKRIPRKNVRAFCGKPIIAWSIDKAKESGCFDRILVSTNDEETRQIAIEYGAEVPFLRPSELCGDRTPLRPVLHHAVQWLADHEVLPELACCILATAPMIEVADILRGRRDLVERGADFAVAVATFPYPIQRALRIEDTGRLVMIEPQYSKERSQDLPEALHDAGQFYWARSAALLGSTAMLDGAVPVLVPRWRVQDIDTEEDWTRAEIMFASWSAIPRDELQTMHADTAPSGDGPLLA